MSTDPSKSVWLSDLEAAVVAVSEAFGNTPKDTPPWMVMALTDIDTALSDAYACVAHDPSVHTEAWLNRQCVDFLFDFGSRSRLAMRRREEARASARERVQAMHDELDTPAEG